jgi:hypothetical protein
VRPRNGQDCNRLDHVTIRNAASETT